MNKKLLVEERSQLAAVMKDITSGRIRIHADQDEYLASLKRRIVELDYEIVGS